MKFCLRTAIYLLVMCAAVTLNCKYTAAQGQDLDNLAKRLSHQIEKSGIHSVVVADFVNQEGESSLAGYFLACGIAQGIDRHKKHYIVVDRGQLSAELLRLKLQPRDLSAPDSLQRIGDSLRVDAVATGTLETTPTEYLVKVSLRSVKDGGLLGSGNESIKRPSIADGMMAVTANAHPGEISVAGQDGIGLPTCKSCPPPLYTDEARAARVEGSVVMVIIVSAEGRAGQMAVIKNLDEGLASRSIEAVSRWKFKPALDRNGKPVSVVVPIEITFRLRS